VSGADPHDLVVLPPVADDPIFSEPLFEATPSPRSRLGEDPHDFAALFIRHRWSFQLHASRFLHDQRDIDEVVQEGFLKLFLALPELETELQALAYARRTITNLCIDRYRADQRRPRLVDLETIPWHALPDEDDDDPVVAAEDAAIVREALAMLSPLHRDALIKREIEEKALPVIAAELEIPVEQVKHVLHRARRSLRRLLVGTHVEPGVDLDLALVLEANRARAARAAKPTGAAVLAVLLVLAGVFGLRSNTPRRVVAVAPSSAPADGLLGAPTPPQQQAPDPVPAAPTGATPASGAGASTGRTPPAHHARTPAGKPTSAPAVPPVDAPIGSDGGSKPPVVVPQPVTHQAFVVTGVGGFGTAQVSDQQRTLRSQGLVSSSTISTATEHGTYALHQAYTFAEDGSLVSASFNEAVPMSSGGVVGTLLDAGSTSVESLTDGAVRLTTTGTATPVGEVNDQTVAPRTLTVDVVLAPDRVQILSEQVRVKTEPTTPPGAWPDESVAIAAGRSETPAAPSPSALSASTPLFGAQERARRSDAAVIDEPSTSR
jgi:RNA polymerase sigma factor (sigma-70 family)